MLAPCFFVPSYSCDGFYARWPFFVSSPFLWLNQGCEAPLRPPLWTPRGMSCARRGNVLLSLMTRLLVSVLVRRRVTRRNNPLCTDPPEAERERPVHANARERVYDTCSLASPLSHGNVRLRRGNKRTLTWERMTAYRERFLPEPTIHHPYPLERMGVVTRGRSRMR